MKTNFKICQFSRFQLRSGYAIQVKIWKRLKLHNSVPFIKKRLVNHLYIRIWSSWLTFTVLQWMKKNSKIGQFSSFLLKVCDLGENLKMIKTSSFFSIHQENTCKTSLHLNLIIFTDFHSFTVNEDKLQN